MKKLVQLFIVLFLISCTEQTDEVKIIRNLDADYYTEKTVDREPGNDEQIDMLQNDLKKIVAEVTENEPKPVRVLIHHRLYLDEEGNVVSIMPLDDQYDFSNFSTDYENYENLDKVTLALADYASKWKFDPAVKDGENVNFRSDIKLVYIAKEDGTIEESFQAEKYSTGDLSDLNISVSSKYFVAAEQMPTPIGGMAAIQEKITYPEEAKRQGVEGRVFVKAYINEKGEVDMVDLLKGIGAGCDSVALNAIKQTKFTPAKQRGEAVKVQVSIPLVFKLR